MRAFRPFLCEVRRRAPGLVGILLMLPVLAACDSGSTGPEDHRIGPEGGDVSLAGGSVKLSVPPDALSATVEFTATPSSSHPESDLLVPGSIYEVLPSDVAFDRLVRVTLSYDPQNLPESVEETELSLSQVVDGRWEMVVNSTVDIGARTVSGTVSSLGLFAAKGVPVASVRIHPSHYTLEMGQTKRFTGVGLDASYHSLPGRPVTWESSDEDVVMVDAEGLVTATGVGSALITVTAEGTTGAVDVNTWNCHLQTEVAPTECQALIDLYGAVNTQDWRTSHNWVPGPGPCTWRGVTCEEGAVSEVYLVNKGLAGSIPFSISDLTSLRHLDLSRNSLSGPIPYSLGELSELITLNLSVNQFWGSIPPELGALSNLQALFLSTNELSGPIPPELGNLSNLLELNLRSNRISGSIPPELGNLTNLLNLVLMSNELTGSIPGELGGLAALSTMSLHFNQLWGQIPPELGNLTNLVRLTLSRNQLTGSIPAAIGNLDKLEWLYLSENQLSGTVPLAVAQLGGRIQALQGGLDQCEFTPPGNTLLNMPDNQDYRDADQNGDGSICGVSIGSG